MAHIKTTKGLNIPIKGEPQGEVSELEADGRKVDPKEISLNLVPFEGMRFKIHAKDGDAVKLGQPIIEDKNTEGRMFCAPATGTIKEIKRGLKRRLLNIVIEVADKEETHDHGAVEIASATREILIQKLMQGGMFARIRQRPFDLLANPEKTPRAIFVKAVNTAPFAVPPEMQVQGNEKDFQQGLNALAKLTDGTVHLVYDHHSSCSAFTQAQNVQKHTVEGPHPVGNQSVHIHNIEPIRKVEEVVWTVTALDVVLIGHLLRTGKYKVDRVVSIAGPGVIPEKTGYYRVREGFPVSGLIAGRIPKGVMRFISGDPLTGTKVEAEDFLGFYDTAFCVIPENRTRELLHFFRLGIDKFSASRTYLSGMRKGSGKHYNFTTNQHGEERGFIISSPYDNVMPMNIPTMQLVKAVMSEDYELAEELGFLEVASEDFALATFVCPSKKEMSDIVKNALRDYSAEVL